MKRESSIELLRIISMLFIVLHHACINNGLILFSEEFSLNHVIIALLGIWGTAGFTIFFCISFWYMLDDKYHFQSSKIVRLIIEAVAYAICALGIAKVCFGESVLVNDLVKTILSPFLNTFWFLTAYIIVYMLMPFVRKMLHALSNSQIITLTTLLVIFVPIYRGGYSLAPIGNICLVLYIVVVVEALKRNYNVIKKFAGRTLLISISIAVLGMVLAFYLNKGQSGIYDVLVNRWSIVQSITGFSFFVWYKEKFSFSSKAINECSKAMFGLYIVHSSPYLAKHIWQDIFDLCNNFYTNFFVLRLLISAVVVMMCGVVMIYIIHFILNKIPIHIRLLDKLDAFWLM